MTVIRQKTDTALSYLPGFGNEHVSEAIARSQVMDLHNRRCP
jgi:hypothetical protein